MLLSAAYPDMAQALKGDLVGMMVRIVLRCAANRKKNGGTYVSIEYCAGGANLTLQCITQGLESLALDLEYSCRHDMLSPEGLRTWIDALVESKVNSLQWYGTRCSSWVPLCQSGSKRNKNNGWWGDMAKPWVVTGNCQMVVTSLMMALSWLCDNAPVLEQPSGSCMPKAEPLKGVFWPVTR